MRQKEIAWNELREQMTKREVVQRQDITMNVDVSDRVAYEVLREVEQMGAFRGVLDKYAHSETCYLVPYTGDER